MRTGENNITTVDASKLINFDNKLAYYATELGIEPGEYDYVSRDGLLLDRDYFETAAEIAMNGKRMWTRVSTCTDC